MGEELRFAYYPGCSAHSTSKEYETSFRYVCEKLGITLVDIENWVCCGASAGHFYDIGFSVALACDTLVKARDIGLPLITVCPACYNRLLHANYLIREDGELAKRVADTIGSEYDGQHEVYNILDAFSKIDIEEAKPIVERPLDGLKVACYYGCLFTRPPKMTNFKRYEDPLVMENILSLTGVDPVDYNHKVNCCGGSLSLSNTEVLGKLVGEILDDAIRNGAEVIATACPLCQSTLELRQNEASKYLGRKIRVPITYFTQLMAYSFGADKKTVGFGRNWISPASIINDLEKREVKAG
ncbi:MAG TPA: heterodisulfide reductase subunit B [Firmicutes bacterium]|nr:heterodisulfide reductase subunit B [Bacillota bacterium]